MVDEESRQVKQLPAAINELRNAAMITRCHTERVICPQTVAEHSYHVAMLCWKLCDHEPSAELLKAAMFHDLAEKFTGDIPAPVKWRSPVISAELLKQEAVFEKEHKLYCSLTPKEELVLKWADSLELMWYCVDEVTLGNRFVEEMYWNIDSFLTDLEPVKNALNELSKVRTAYAIANSR
jgi:5'-deoxynucleotidase YfbR-like HD superfamily hydrolase